MNPTELAKLLIESSPDRRLSLLREHEPLPAVEISESMQTLCYEVWTSDPQKVSSISHALELLAEYTKSPEVKGYSEWTRAINALVEGDLEACIRLLDASELIFANISQAHLAARTQTSKLYALALLGRYDEAVECGLKAREVFLRHDDLYSAGKIEHNIGNLFWRRDMYRESEPYLESAHERFTQIGDQRQLAMVENCQAFVKTLQNDFRGAEIIYRSALDRANGNNFVVTAAEIETGLSNLYLFAGKYDLALKLMESSRRKYEELCMANKSANCELEIADIYLELSLLAEALGFYEKVEGRFETLRLQAEHARCSLGHARTLFRLDKFPEAARELDIAEDLYHKEGNLVAVGSVKLARSQLLFRSGSINDAEHQVGLALAAFEQGQNIRLEIAARWFRTEIWCALSRINEAKAELNKIVPAAKVHSKEVEYLCHVSLGKMTGKEAHFIAAVDLVEDSRVTLASEELRTAYFADKVVPYNELVKIKLAQQQFEAAFLWHERSRSRSMRESLVTTGGSPHSNNQLREIREELNWYQNRLNRGGHATEAERKTALGLKKAAENLEREYSEMLRRLHSDGLPLSADIGDLNIDEFRSRLDDSTLVEFVSIDGWLSAFLISRDRFTALPNYLDESEIDREIKQFLFQLRTGRILDRLSMPNRRAAFDRLKTHSRRIYDLLLEPLKDSLSGKRIVFAPAGPLHGVPFHALHDGTSFLIERYQVSYTPSSVVLDNCLKKPAAEYGRALIAGNADELTPMVETEIECVSQFFDEPVRLFGSELTVADLTRHSAGKGVVHLACHGKFRSDNPGFSSLTLFAEELTANEIQNLQLENGIIVLSSCESGLNEVVRGEELIGLTRAFFAAGAATIVQSLWRVNDRATPEIMKAFYAELCVGNSASEAMRKAQLVMIGQEIHPYFWSPFVVTGRW